MKYSIKPDKRKLTKKELKVWQEALLEIVKKDAEKLVGEMKYVDSLTDMLPLGEETFRPRSILCRDFIEDYLYAIRHLGEL